MHRLNSQHQQAQRRRSVFYSGDNMSKKKKDLTIEAPVEGAAGEEIAAGVDLSSFELKLESAETSGEPEDTDDLDAGLEGDPGELGDVGEPGVTPSAETNDVFDVVKDAASPSAETFDGKEEVPVVKSNIRIRQFGVVKGEAAEELRKREKA